MTAGTPYPGFAVSKEVARTIGTSREGYVVLEKVSLSSVMMMMMMICNGRPADVWGDDVDVV